jgi:hypothetical protein
MAYIRRYLTDFDSDIESHKRAWKPCMPNQLVLSIKKLTMPKSITGAYQDLGGLQREIKHFESWEPISIKQLGH